MKQTRLASIPFRRVGREFCRQRNVFRGIIRPCVSKKKRPINQSNTIYVFVPQITCLTVTFAECKYELENIGRDQANLHKEKIRPNKLSVPQARLIKGKDQSDIQPKENTGTHPTLQIQQQQPYTTVGRRTCYAETAVTHFPGGTWFYSAMNRYQIGAHSFQHGKKITVHTPYATKSTERNS